MVLIKLCDVGYCYSQQLIKISNDDIENEEKYNTACDVLENTIVLTEKLFKRHSDNIEILEHLYKLYIQNEKQDQAENIKSRLKMLGVEYLCEE